MSAKPREFPGAKWARKNSIPITAGGTGKLLPGRELDLGFRSGGIVAEISIEVGDRVAAGDGLTRLEVAFARAQVAQAEAKQRFRSFTQVVGSRSLRP